MYVTTSLSASDLERIARDIAATSYGGADAVTLEIEPTGTAARERRRFRVKIGAADSRGPAARRSWSGRRGPWACWHVFRDVFAAWFAADPLAVVRTGMETYRTADGFLERFGATGEVNAGSMAQPVSLADLCECESDGGRDDNRRADYVDHVDILERRVLEFLDN